jgi:hypothetical protein
MIHHPEKPALYFWKGGFAFSAFFESHSQIPSVLSESSTSPILGANLSKTGWEFARVKKCLSHSRPSSFSFFLRSRCSFSILVFSAAVRSMSPLPMACATFCHARLDSSSSCSSIAATAKPVTGVLTGSYESISFLVFASLTEKEAVHWPSTR